MTEVITDSDKNFLAAVSGNEKLGYDTYKVSTFYFKINLKFDIYFW